MPRRELTSHKVAGAHDGLDLHVMDDPGPGGACRHYRATFSGGPDATEAEVISGVVDLTFQDGNPARIGTNGLTNEALLAIVIDRLYGFQRGPAPCNENGCALQNLENALGFLKARSEARILRGVEGTLTP